MARQLTEFDFSFSKLLITPPEHRKPEEIRKYTVEVRKFLTETLAKGPSGN